MAVFEQENSEERQQLKVFQKELWREKPDTGQLKQFVMLLKRALDNAEERKAEENEQASLSECHTEFFEYRSVLFTGKPATEASDEK